MSWLQPSALFFPLYSLLSYRTVNEFELQETHERRNAIRTPKTRVCPSQRSNTGDRGPSPLVKGRCWLRHVLVNRRARSCFTNGMIVLLCLVPFRTQEPLSKFPVSRGEKTRGPISLVRAISSPVATALSTRVPISVGRSHPGLPVTGSVSTVPLCPPHSRHVKPSIGFVQSPDHPHALAHPTVHIKSSEITICYLVGQ